MFSQVKALMSKSKEDNTGTFYLTMKKCESLDFHRHIASWNWVGFAWLASCGVRTVVRSLRRNLRSPLNPELMPASNCSIATRGGG